MKRNNMINGICYIVGAMQKAPIAITRKKEDYLIAADGGYAWLGEEKPDRIIGDFDSLGYIPNEKHVLQYPKEKDDTDMLLAVKNGLEMGYKKFIIYGGLGGRLDHTIANIQVLAFLKKQGANGLLIGDGQEVFILCNEKKSFSAQEKGTISVFAFGEYAKKVSIRGFKYEVEDVTITDTYPIGISNEFIGQEAFLEVKEGRLLIVRTDLMGRNNGISNYQE